MPTRPNERSELIIDKNDLDREVCEQSSRSGGAALEAARLTSVRDQAKDRLKVGLAEIALRIREEHLDDARKPTEAQIEAWVTVDPDRQRLQSAYLDAEAELALAESRRDAWRERGFMMRTLAELYASQYWAKVSMQGTQHEVAERQGDVARQAVAAERRRLRQTGGQ